MGIINALKKLFTIETVEPAIKKNVVDFMYNIKDIIFENIFKDEQLLGYLKGNNKITIEISFKNDKLKIYITGTYT